MSLNIKSILSWAIFAVGLLVLIFLWRTKPTEASFEKTEQVWQVDVITAHPARLSPTLLVYGQVETPALQKAAAPRKSRVKEVLVKQGEKVSPQQLLLTLDPRDFKPRVQQAKAEIAKLKAQIAKENLSYLSHKKALTQEQTVLNLNEAEDKPTTEIKIKNLDSVPILGQAKQPNEIQQLALTARKLAIETQTAKLQQLKARLDSAKASLDLAYLDLERSRIQADFSGAIASVDVSIGDPVNTNQQLLTLYPNDNLEIRAKIPAPYQDEIQQSIQQNLRLKAKTAIAGSTIQVVLDRLAGQADGRGIDAFFKITDPNENIHLGTTVSLRLQRPPRDHAVIVPKQALYDNSRLFKLVYGRLQSVDVSTLGEYIDDHGHTYLLVSDPGLMGGDQIVITHLPNAITGLRVSALAPKKEIETP